MRAGTPACARPARAQAHRLRRHPVPDPVRGSRDQSRELSAVHQRVDVEGKVSRKIRWWMMSENAVTCGEPDRTDALRIPLLRPRRGSADMVSVGYRPLVQMASKLRCGYSRP